jgi:signal transduction histidine kinase
MYFQEASQKLNANVAKHIAAESVYFTNGKVNEKELQSIFHNVMVINPSIEVYLLDENGNILTYYAPNKIIELKKIKLNPVKDFINDTTGSFHMGPDPKNAKGEKVFSAAPVYENNVLKGYIYVILNGEEYENATQFLLGSYIMRIGLRSISFTLLAAAVIGLVILGFITRNLKKIISAIREFKNGNLNARIKLKGKGEFGEFADAYNEMADTIVRNIDEIKTMDYLRRELVENVSHDLRTPLAAIQGYIETILIKSEHLSEDERKEYMNTILSSTERLKKLVEELFELSKLEARQTKPHHEQFSITELVQDIHQKNLLIAESRGVKLILDFPYDIPYVYADIGMMEKVIQNLLDNAFKFTPRNQKITIQLRRQHENILISVSDTGIGIRKGDLPFIFERYQKAKRIGITDNDGLGLGLAIVKKILEVHNIEIYVKSDEGKGTSFSFTIPVYKGQIEKQYQSY